MPIQNDKLRLSCIILIVVCFLVLDACQDSDQYREETAILNEGEINGTLAIVTDLDTLQKWQDWAMSSDEGLWKNDPSQKITMTLLRTYGGEDNPNPQFFTVKWMEVSGDTLFISDRARECLVCMNSDGEVLWEYGEPGEGPGHFTCIGSIAVSDSWIAVCNTIGDRVELISRAGEPIDTYSLMNPLCVVTVSDEEFVVLSRAEYGGDIHLYNIHEGHTASFGECPWPGGEVTSRSTNEYSAVCVDTRYLVMNDFYTYRLFLFDLDEQELISSFIREHPSGNLPVSSMTQMDDGSVSGLFFFVLGKLFVCPCGVINIKLAAIQKDGTVISSRETIGPAPVTIIDRYSMNGEYLDSYCIPLPNCTEFRYSEPYLYVAQSNTGTIYQFSVDGGHQ
jgi:hypothetical protein